MGLRLFALLGLAGLLAMPLAARAAQDEGVAALGAGPVAVAPLNLAVRVVPELEAGLEPVGRALLAHLASAGPRVIALDRDGSSALWREVIAEAGAGTGDDALFSAYARFARQVAQQAEFSAIVFPSLVARAVRVTGRVASWDRVRRPVLVPGLDSEAIDAFPRGNIWVTRHGVRGELAGASLHVAILSPAGALRFQRSAGLVLLQRLGAPEERGDLELRVLPDADAFDDARGLREGVGLAFR